MDLVTAHVSTPISFRGGENQALMLMRGLMSRGHRAAVVCPPGSEMAARARAAEIEVRELPMRSELDVASIWRLAGWLRRLRPEAIQFHDGHAVTIGGVAARMARVPLRAASRRVDYEIRRAWKWRRLANCIIAISKAVRDIVVRAGVDAARVRVVNSAFDPARFEGRDGVRARRSVGLGEKVRILLCPAALVHQKNHAALLDAFAVVAERLPDTVLLLAGEGELERDLRAQAEALRLLPERVRFLGYRRDVPDLLAASDLFVMASRYEGLCSVALEAMWCCVPVVTTDAGGLPEAVGECGRVVPVGDPRAFADAVVDALTDRGKTQRLARAARERVEKHFNADVMVEGTLAVYREFLGHR